MAKNRKRYFKVGGKTENYPFQTKIFLDFGDALAYYDEILNSVIMEESPVYVNMSTYLDNQIKERDIMTFRYNSESEFSFDRMDENGITRVMEGMTRKLGREDFKPKSQLYAKQFNDCSMFRCAMEKEEYTKLAEIASEYDTSASEIVRVLIKSFIDYTK